MEERNLASKRAFFHRLFAATVVSAAHYFCASYPSRCPLVVSDKCIYLAQLTDADSAIHAFAGIIV